MSRILPWFCLVSMILALYGAFLYAPREATMGDVQRIFYFHLPAWWLAGIAFGLNFIASITYLVTGKRSVDNLALASAEVGVLFTSVGLVTGPIWAKYAWGVFWTWDMRLTFALVLWLLYVSYLMLRRYVPEEEKRAKLAAVLGIIAFVDVPLVWFSIRWWRTQHPQPVIGSGEESGMEPEMWHAMYVSLAAFTLLLFWLLQRRMALESARQEIDYLYKELDVS